MTPQIIPSINTQTFQEAKQKIHLIEPYVRWCHLDVTDGVFSRHETWRNPADLESLETALGVEVHLMVSEPERAVDEWLRPPVKRIIIHTEAIKDFNTIREKARDRGIKVGVAVNPETPVEAFGPYIGKADLYLCLTVHPGPSGQKMAENTAEKVGSLRKMCASCIIEVDGGINSETAEKMIEAGANILVAGTYIFSSPDIKSSIEILRGRIL